jgi:hypothetical protein
MWKPGLSSGLTGPRRKYGNHRVSIDGYTFDSKKEGRRYTELKLLARAGKITKLMLQPAFTLQDAFVDRDGTPHKRIVYLADFSYTDEQGRTVVEDVKSEATAKDKVYVLKKKLFLKRYQEYVFSEV